MKANTGNTVRRTIVLMIASMLLLTSFVCYWLNSQYNDEQQALRKELLADVATLQREITDSIILEKYLGPVMKFNKDPLFTIKPMAKNDGDTSTRKGHTFTFHGTPADSIKIDSFNRVISAREESISTQSDTMKRVFTTITLTDGETKISERKMMAPKPGGKLMDNIDLETTITAEQLATADTPIVATLYNLIRVAMKEAMKDSINKLSMILEPADFELIHKEFAKGLSLRNNAMKATWYSDIDSPKTLPDSNKVMLVHYNIYSNSGIML